MRGVVFAATLMAFSLAAPVASAAGKPNPFLGTWTVTDVKVGPWVKAGEQPLPVDPTLLHAKVTFTATSVKGPRALACPKATYEMITGEPEFLFEGGLPNPKADARALGFTTDHFPAMRFGCDRPDADQEMDYAMADKNTVMFGLNDRVYIMKRTPPK